jgi:hypothetical protein
MDEYESLSHSRWECKYHVVFIPKCRRKVLYGQLRKHLGEVLHRASLEQPPPMFTSMSWSANLLAVVGGGFQIFHFNGASPLTPFIGLQRGTDDISQAAWDNDNHFYTLDFFGGQLRVFTVTPTSFSEDPGSPVDANGGGIVVVNHAP